MKSSLGQGDVVVTQLEGGELLQSHEGVLGNLGNMILGQVQEVQGGQGLQGPIRHRGEEVLLQIEVLQVLFLSSEGALFDCLDLAVAELNVVKAQLGKDVRLQSLNCRVVDVEQVDRLGLGVGVERIEEGGKVGLRVCGGGVEKKRRDVCLVICN